MKLIESLKSLLARDLPLTATTVACSNEIYNHFIEEARLVQLNMMAFMSLAGEARIPCHVDSSDQTRDLN